MSVNPDDPERFLWNDEEVIKRGKVDRPNINDQEDSPADDEPAAQEEEER